jgi:hypothetical protein
MGLTIRKEGAAQRLIRILKATSKACADSLQRDKDRILLEYYPSNNGLCTLLRTAEVEEMEACGVTAFTVLDYFYSRYARLYPDERNMINAGVNYLSFGAGAEGATTVAGWFECDTVIDKEQYIDVWYSVRKKFIDEWIEELENQLSDLSVCQY